MADSPKSDDNVDVNPIDILIIKGVEKNKILYDPSCYVDEGYKFSELTEYKTLAFESISKTILDRFDKEMTCKYIFVVLGEVIFKLIFKSIYLFI